MPGVIISSPMTPNEYKKVYSSFLRNDDVYYVSEHRGSYNNKSNLPDVYYNKPDMVIFAISITRFEAKKAQQLLMKEKIKVSIVNILWIKPLKVSKKSLDNLKKSKYGGIVMDDDYKNGIAKSIANDLSLKTNKLVSTMGLQDKTAGTGKKLDNLPPTAKEIYNNVKNIIKNGF